MIFGISWGIFLLAFCWPVAEIIFAIWYRIRNKYEGEDIEKEYGIDNWYHTF